MPRFERGGRRFESCRGCHLAEAGHGRAPVAVTHPFRLWRFDSVPPHRVSKRHTRRAEPGARQVSYACGGLVRLQRSPCTASSDRGRGVSGSTRGCGPRGVGSSPTGHSHTGDGGTRHGLAAGAPNLARSGSNPDVPVPGRIAQWVSARLTRERSLVRTQVRPSHGRTSRQPAPASVSKTGGRITRRGSSTLPPSSSPES